MLRVISATGHCTLSLAEGPLGLRTEDGHFGSRAALHWKAENGRSGPSRTAEFKYPILEDTMTEPLSVNAALLNLSTLDGNDVQIKGILHFDFEDVALYHHPSSERKDGCDSSIWLGVGMGSLGFDQKTCARLNGKLVTVQGTLHSPDARFGGCGHMSLWPAALLARTLERA